MKRFFLVLLFLSLVASLCGLSVEEKLRQQEEELKRIEQRLRESKKRAKELKGEESGILREIQRIDEMLEITQGVLDQLARKEKLLTEELSVLEERIKTTDEALALREEILMRRLRSIYKHGRIGLLQVLLTSNSFVDAVKRMKYLTMVAEQDHRVYHEILHLRDRLEWEKELHRRRLQDLQLVKEQVRKEELVVMEEKKKKKEVLKRVRSKRAEQEKIVQELAESEKKIMSLIERLEEERKRLEREKGRTVLPGTHYFDLNKGKVMWPAKGKIVAGFGRIVHPKYGTSVKNNGIDIEAPMGRPVKAVYDGKVVYAGKFLGYGRVVLIDHDGGYYTLYAHLSEMRVALDQQVETGQVIGLVGDSGSLKGPILHFEIRKDGKPVDPLVYLRR